MIKSKIIAGIDVGSSKTTTIIASVPEDEEAIKIIGVASLPSRGIRKGQIVNIEEASESVINSVEAAERMAGYNLNQALVSVGGPHIASQNSKGVVAVAEPEGEIVSDDVDRVIEAARAISLPSSREIIHVLPRDFTVDGQEGIRDPIGMSGVRLEIETHIITGASTAVRNLVKCISEVGANVQNLVSNGLASSESILTETEKELGVILVDIGGGTTDLVIFVEGSPFYSAVLPIGAKNVTNDLAIGVRLSLEAAEKVKLSLSKKEKRPILPERNKLSPGEKELGEKEKKSAKGESSSKKQDDDEINLAELGIDNEGTRTISRKTLVEGIIKPRLNEIFTMVGLELKKSGAVGLTPAGVVVCGGGAQTAGVVNAVKRTLAMPVRIGTPQGVSGLIDEVQTPDFATAIGLIIYGAKMEPGPGVGFSFARFSKGLRKIPGRGIAGRVVEMVKSFLP